MSSRREAATRGSSWQMCIRDSSETDAEEALLAGSAAVQAAVDGFTDKMVAFRCTRGEDGYRCETVLEPLDIVANFEKKVPREWINEAGNGVNQQFIDYVLPLIQGDEMCIRDRSPSPPRRSGRCGPAGAGSGAGPRYC